MQSLCRPFEMRAPLNTFVDLLADFPKPSFPGEAPGKELAETLARGLEKRGIQILNVEGPDIAHYVRCLCEDRQFDIMVTIDDVGRMNRWHVLPSFRVSLTDRIRGKDYGAAFEQLLFAIDETLKESNQIRDVRWFPAFDTPPYLDLQLPSDGPIRDPNLDKQAPMVIRADRFASSVFSRCASPIGCILMFSSFVVIGILAPKLLPIIALAYFIFLGVVGMLFPMLLSSYLSYLHKPGDPDVRRPE